MANEIRTPDAELFPKFVRRRMGDEIYDVLKERILSKQFAPGQRLNPGLLERQMGVSRTPLTEAFNRLAIEELVEIRPRKGIFVSDLTPTDVAEAYDVRRVLEIHAAELAAARMNEAQLGQLRQKVSELRGCASGEDWNAAYQRYVVLDHDFHLLILEFSGNKRLLTTWQQIDLHSVLARVFYRRAERELADSQGEHEAILAAFETRDTSQVCRAVEQHIHRAMQSLLHDMQEHILQLTHTSERR